MLVDLTSPGDQFFSHSNGTAPDYGPRWAFEPIFKFDRVATVPSM